MKQRKRIRPREHGALVLDNEGLSRAATDRVMYVRLHAAHLDGRRVLTSAAILAEALRDTSRDAGVYRVLGGVVVEPVTREIGEQAGKLIGAAGMSADQAVDAMVAATALDQEGPVVVVTSDVPHLTALTAGHERIQVVHVDKISR
ncbi:type II toxin-antitoxin system VapC family toxin [Microbispora hainanensis]|uniref:type II toxin-antitoxin system VapC family toxin n=1 Tax=Microbispora hainanensis TaxID=568844 RepID=UPI001157F120|nr:type II toxin-antitoxin system VapC family toxin [Microbispora hainanensis]